MNSNQSHLARPGSYSVYLSLGRRRLFNLVAVERGMLYLLLVSLMVPLVLRREIYFYTFDPFLLALYGIWFFRIIHSDERTEKRYFTHRGLALIDVLLALLVFWSLFSIIISVQPNASLNSWLLFIRGVLLYSYLRFNFGKIIQPQQLQRIIGILLLLESVLAIVQFATNSRLGSFNDLFGEVETYKNAYFYTSFGPVIRTVGTFHNPNLLADWIILLLPLIMAKLYFGTAKPKKLYYLLLVLALLALMFTFARSAWVSLIVIFIVMLVRVVSFKQKRIGLLFVRTIRYGIVFLVLIGLAYSISNYWFDNFSIEIIRDRFSNISGGGEWRLAYINIAFQLMQRFPLTGVGFGTFSQALTEYRQVLDIPRVLASSDQFSSVHNVYLLFFAEVGVVGGVLWLLLCIAATVKSWRVYAKLAVCGPQFAVFALWLLAAWIGIVFNSNFEAVFFHPTIMMLIFMFLGLIVASSYSKQLRYYSSLQPGQNE